MFRATCDCAKLNVSRVKLMPSWVNRKCKECKSNLKVYSGSMLVFDYNVASERAKARGRHYLKVKNGKIVMPRLIQLPPVPPPSPIIRDVFMGFEPKPYFNDELNTMFEQFYSEVNSIYEEFDNQVKFEDQFGEMPLFGQNTFPF